MAEHIWPLISLLFTSANWFYCQIYLDRTSTEIDATINGIYHHKTNWLPLLCTFAHAAISTACIKRGTYQEWNRYLEMTLNDDARLQRYMYIYFIYQKSMVNSCIISNHTPFLSKRSSQYTSIISTDSWKIDVFIQTASQQQWAMFLTRRTYDSVIFMTHDVYTINSIASRMNNPSRINWMKEVLSNYPRRRNWIRFFSWVVGNRLRETRTYANACGDDLSMNILQRFGLRYGTVACVWQRRFVNVYHNTTAIANCCARQFVNWRDVDEWQCSGAKNSADSAASTHIYVW